MRAAKVAAGGSESCRGSTPGRTGWEVLSAMTGDVQLPLPPGDDHTDPGGAVRQDRVVEGGEGAVAGAKSTMIETALHQQLSATIRAGRAKSAVIETVLHPPPLWGRAGEGGSGQPWDRRIVNKFVRPFGEEHKAARCFVKRSSSPPPRRVLFRAGSRKITFAAYSWNTSPPAMKHCSSKAVLVWPKCTPVATQAALRRSESWGLASC